MGAGRVGAAAAAGAAGVRHAAGLSAGVGVFGVMRDVAAKEGVGALMTGCVSICNSASLTPNPEPSNDTLHLTS